jgi:hypothetical protein
MAPTTSKPALLFVTAVNRSPFFAPMVGASLDSDGSWTIGAGMVLESASLLLPSWTLWSADMPQSNDSKAPPPDKDGDTGSQKPEPRPNHLSVLKSMERKGKRAPKVLLRESETEQAALVKPGGHDVVLGRTSNERYQILGELARGGVGVVLKGHDVDLGRDVAMKVLLQEHADNEAVHERFVEEAQIGGQLQHPGIVPVYEMGLQADERPYFTMKLVKGRTLAEILADRQDVSSGLRRFVTIFEQVCQTMAYAH